MRDDWDAVTFRDIADFTNGYPFKPADLQGSSLPVIRIKQLLDISAETDFTDLEVPERNLIMDGDLIFSWSGTLASRFWNRGPAALNQHLFRVTAKSGSDIGWVHLALDHAVEELSTKTHGTTMKHITKGVLESHRILRPPLPVQRRIVDLMAHLDKHLESCTSEIMALTTLQAESRRELTSQANGGTERTVGEVSSFAGGYAFSDRFQGQDQGDFPFYKVSDMNRPNSEKYMRDAANYVDSAILREMKAKAWPSGTIVFPKVGAALKTEKRRILSQQSAFDNNCMGLIPGPDVLSEFLFARMCAVRLADFAQEGAVPSVNQSHLVGIPIWLPSLAEQEAICEFFLALDYCLERLRKEAQALTQLRSSLLSELLSETTTLPIEYDSIISEVA